MSYMSIDPQISAFIAGANLGTLADNDESDAAEFLATNYGFEIA